MNYYYDTSAFCRYYHPEPGSSVVESLVLTPDATHVLSWLTVLEATSAFALKVRTGEISVADFHLLQSRLKADLAISRFVVARVLRRHFDGARQLLLKYGPKKRLRSLDAIHLGIALDLWSLGRIDTLVSADSTVIDVARSQALTVIDPLHPIS